MPAKSWNLALLCRSSSGSGSCAWPAPGGEVVRCSRSQLVDRGKIIEAAAQSRGRRSARKWPR
eukprot:4861615-Pyramimonas_sp.AAC.1